MKYIKKKLQNRKRLKSFKISNSFKIVDISNLPSYL